MTLKLLYVEDSYGIEFHKEMLRRLADLKILVIKGGYPEIRRLPVKECNPALERKVLARVMGCEDFKILIVVDTELRPRDEVRKNVVRHFRKISANLIEVSLVNPRHEKWLCIGLGSEPSKCRHNPESTIERIINRTYEKYMLGTLSHSVDVRKLLRDDDFKEYLDKVRWLLK